MVSGKYLNLSGVPVNVDTVKGLPTHLMDEIHEALHGGVARNVMRLSEIMDAVHATHIVVDYTTLDDSAKFIVDKLKIIRPGAVIDINDIR